MFNCDCTKCEEEREQPDLTSDEESEEED